MDSIPLNKYLNLIYLAAIRKDYKMSNSYGAVKVEVCSNLELD